MKPHLIKRLKIRIMHTPFTMEFGLAPLIVHVVVFIGCGIFVAVAGIVLTWIMK